MPSLTSTTDLRRRVVPWCTLTNMPTTWLYARLSRTTEASTSVERQLREERDLAERRWPADPCVEVADDGISGALDPAKRKGFGSIIERCAPGDRIVFYSLDRLARSITGFVDTMQYVQQQELSLVCIREPLDLTTPHGRMQANILVTFAEYERELVRIRVNNMRAYLHKEGRWPGGRAPYGLKSAPNSDGKGRVLVRDEYAAGIVEEIARRIIGGESMTVVAADLQDRGVPSPRMQTAIKETAKTAAWSSRAIRIILASPTIVGHAIDPTTGRVRRESGRPIEVWPPVITEEEQARALAALPENTGRQASQGRHWLYGVAVCGVCGRAMKGTANGGKYSPTTRTRRCWGSLKEKHGIVSVLEAALDEYMNAEVDFWLSSLRVHERVLQPSTRKEDDLDQLRRFADELQEDRKAGLYDTEEGKARYRQQYTETMQEIEALEATTTAAPTWLASPGDETYGDAWARWTPEQRGAELRDMGVRLVVNRPAVKRARVPLADRAHIDWGDLSDAVEEMRGILVSEEHGPSPTARKG